MCCNYGAHFVDLCGQHTPCLNGGTCNSTGSDSGYIHVLVLLVILGGTVLFMMAVPPMCV